MLLFNNFPKESKFKEIVFWEKLAAVYKIQHSAYYK
jgi:hypothetical protein